MRIALVITELDPGGAELCITELALYLAQHGHDIRVWCIGAAPPVGRDGLLVRLSAAGIAVQFATGRGTLDAWRVVRWLKRELQTFAPDIVQSMLWHANLMTAGAVWFSHVPWVAGMRVSEPRSGRWWLERLASRRMQRLVCVSRDVYEHALRHERIAQDKLVIIPNGVPQRLLSETQETGDWQQLVNVSLSQTLLFVGRLEAQKGILPLVEHLPQLLNDQPDWAMMILGDGSLRGAINAEVKALKLDRQIHLLGWQPDAPRWMKAANLLLLPAEYEGMPNVLLEAMAVGKPFVAFAVDGVRQLLDAAQGYPKQLADQQLAAPGDWSEFVRLVRLQMTHGEVRELCGAANQQHVAKCFRLEDQLNKYVQLYESVLKRVD